MQDIVLFMLKLSKAECSIVIDTTPVAISQKQMPNSIGYAVLYVHMYIVCLFVCTQTR